MINKQFDGKFDGKKEQCSKYTTMYCAVGAILSCAKHDEYI